MGKKRVIHHGYRMGLASIKTYPKNYLLYFISLWLAKKVSDGAHAESC